MVPAPIDAEQVDAVRELLGDEILMHHEFVRLDDELVAINLPVVFYTSDERLYEIIRVYEDHGCPVSDHHTFIIEDGGMKHADSLGLEEPSRPPRAAEPRQVEGVVARQAHGPAGDRSPVTGNGTGPCMTLTPFAALRSVRETR